MDNSPTRIFRRPMQPRVERAAWFFLGVFAGLILCGLARFAWPAFFT